MDDLDLTRWLRYVESIAATVVAVAELGRCATEDAPEWTRFIDLAYLVGQ